MENFYAFPFFVPLPSFFACSCFSCLELLSAGGFGWIGKKRSEAKFYLPTLQLVFSALHPSHFCLSIYRLAYTHQLVPREDCLHVSRNLNPFFISCMLWPSGSNRHLIILLFSFCAEIFFRNICLTLFSAVQRGEGCFVPYAGFLREIFIGITQKRQLTPSRLSIFLLFFFFSFDRVYVYFLLKSSVNIHKLIGVESSFFKGEHFFVCCYFFINRLMRVCSTHRDSTRKP